MITCEIHGVGVHNRGAELMAIAVADQLRARDIDNRVIVPSTFGSYADRSRYGFYTTWEFDHSLRSIALDTLPTVFARPLAQLDNRRQRFRAGSSRVQKLGGVLSPDQIDVVFDASGFSFSDQWGPKSSRKLLRKLKYTPRRDKPFVMLPQAFGPFENQEVADSVRRLILKATLCFAREATSYEYVRELVGDLPSVKLAPDFTCDVEPISQLEDVPGECYSAIVPSYRMLDKGAGSEDYLNLLQHLFEQLCRSNLNPVFVLHDSRVDYQIIKSLEERGVKSRTLSHSDPRVLKAILGKASIVVASRFHALVSSLSQGVPCIGAGWSHKYAELFADYGCDEFLIADNCDLERVSNIVETLAPSEKRAELTSRIRCKGKGIKAETKTMWDTVFQAIGAETTPVSGPA